MKPLGRLVCFCGFLSSFAAAQPSLIVEATVAGWDSSQGSLLEAVANGDEILGQAPIAADGSFRIEVNTPSKDLWTVVRQTECREMTIRNTVQISNPNSASSTFGLAVDRSDVNSLSLSDDRDYGDNSVDVMFEYYTEATDITGTVECNDFETDAATGMDFDSIHVYDVSVEAGWSMAVSRAVRDPVTGQYTYYHSALPFGTYPPDVYWRTYDDVF
jgi:hypothetical protein